MIGVLGPPRIGKIAPKELLPHAQPVQVLTPKERTAAKQPTAAKAKASYVGPTKFDALGRKAPRMQHPAHKAKRGS